MNKERRNRISAVIQKLGECKEEIEAIKGDEQDAYDNMPESLQNSYKVEAAQSAIGALQVAEDSIEESTTELEGIE